MAGTDCGAGAERQDGGGFLSRARATGLTVFAWKRRKREQASSGFVQLSVAPELKQEQIAARRSGIEVRLICGRSLMVEPRLRCESPAGIAGGAGEAGHDGAAEFARAGRPRSRRRLWLAREATDMRCGFDRLAERVRAVIGEDPLSGHLFVFRSRRGDRLKILTWDRDGFILWYKRLEAGVFKLPRASEGRVRWSCGPASWR